MTFEVLAIYVAIGKVLSRPNHTISSLNQLARRIKITDDKIRRTINQYSVAVGDPLISNNGRFIAFTDAGLKFFEHAAQFLSSVNEIPASESVEQLNVGVAPGIDQQMLTKPVATLLKEWNGAVALKLHPLSTSVMRDSIMSGAIELGIGWKDGEQDQTEVLEPLLPWHALVPLAHTLAKPAVDEPIGADQLGESADRVFVPGFGGGESHLDQFLCKVLPANRVEVDSPHTVRAMVSAGLGIGLDLDWGKKFVPESGSYSRRSVVGLEPEQLCLYLPKNAAKATQPATCMIDLLRQSMRSRCDTVPNAVEAEVLK